MYSLYPNLIVQVSSQVAFNSQRIKTKDENVNVDNGNHHRRERNGTPRQLNNIDNSHHSNNSGNLGLLELLEFVKDSGNLGYFD